MTKKVKGYKGLPMEGPVARWYTKITYNNYDDFRAQASRLAGMTAKESRILEIAPGPGYLSIELARLGYQVTGLDISKSFVEIAQRKAAEAGCRVDFRQGDAAQMPLPDDSFDLIVCRAAFKNFTQPVNAIAEMYRVLRSNGKAGIFDLRRDASRQAIEEEVKKMGLGRINEMITRWTFRNMLLKNAYTKEDMKSFIAQTPFRKYRVEDDGIGFEAWLEK